MEKTKSWEDIREEASRLYLNGLTLNQVRESIEHKFNFKASARSYRLHFQLWGVTRSSQLRRLRERDSVTLYSPASQNVDSRRDSDSHKDGSFTPVKRSRSSPMASYLKEGVGRTAHQLGSYEPAVACYLKGQSTWIFPDSGSPTNLLSQAFAELLGVNIKDSPSLQFKTAIGRHLQTIGTTTVPFSFSGEEQSYELEFHIAPKLSRDSIVGAPFLQSTKTFTEFKHRIKRRPRRMIPRLGFVSMPQSQMMGFMNGTPAKALPDTGSEILAMSTSYAMIQSLTIDCNEIFRIPVTLADDSTTTTRGLAKNVEWKFLTSRSEAAQTTVYRRNFYVLDDLQCDLILNYDFIEETDAFNIYGDSLLTSLPSHAEYQNAVCGITKAPPVFTKIGRWFNKDNEKKPEEISAIMSLHEARNCLLQAKDERLEEIRRASGVARVRMIEDLEKWWRAEWDAVNARIVAGKLETFVADSSPLDAGNASVQTDLHVRPREDVEEGSTSELPRAIPSSSGQIVQGLQAAGLGLLQAKEQHQTLIQDWHSSKREEAEKEFQALWKPRWDEVRAGLGTLRAPRQAKDRISRVNGGSGQPRPQSPPEETGKAQV